MHFYQYDADREEHNLEEYENIRGTYKLIDDTFEPNNASSKASPSSNLT